MVVPWPVGSKFGSSTLLTETVPYLRFMPPIIFEGPRVEGISGIEAEFSFLTNDLV